MLARYWRVIGLKARYGFGIKICGIELWNYTNRVCQTAAFTSSNVPDIGVLSNLRDESFATECYFSPEVVKNNLTFTWDAGAGNQLDVERLKIRSSNSSNEFVSDFILEYSNDNLTWIIHSDLNSYNVLNYPGDYSLTSIPLINDVFPTKFIKESKDLNIDNTGRITNLNIVTTSNNTVSTSFYLNKGKFYFEFLIGYRFLYVGVGSFYDRNPKLWPGQSAFSAALFLNSGRIWHTNGNNAFDYEANSNVTLAVGKTVGMLVDIDNSRIAYIIDGVTKPYFNLSFSGKFLSVITGFDTDVSNTTDKITTFNFGQDPFMYPVPSGFIAGFGSKYDVDYVENRNFYLNSNLLSSGIATTTMGTYGTYKTESHKQAFSILFGGNGYVKNTVKIKGSPDVAVRRKVILFDFYTKVVVGETWSQEGTGLFEFKHLSMDREYFAMSVDHMGQWQMAAAGPMKPQKMTLV